MVLDVVEEGGGARFQVWGVTPESHSVCVRVNDFCHTFYIAAPRRPVPATPDKPPSGFDPGVHDELISWDAPGRLERLRGLLNRVAPADSQIRAVRAVHRRPIMYYRPDRPDGEIYLELTLNPSGNARKAGTAIQKLIAGRTLQSEGLVWRDKTGYEYEVGPLQRFLADAPLSGGAWVCIPSAAQQHSGPSVATPVKGTSGSGAGNGQNVPGERASAGQHGGYIMVEPNRRVSTCELEVEAPWRSLVCLTPDATQLADADSWDPFKNNPHGAIHAPSAKAQHAAAVAKSGALASLRLMVLDVCTATRDGKERAPVPSQGDPVVAISCAMITDQTCGTGAPEAINPVPDADERSEVIDLAGEHGESDEGGGIGEVLVVEGPTVATHYAQPLSQRKQCALVFVLAGSPADPALGIDGGKGEFREMDTGAMVVLCHSEAELLLTWQRYFHAADPDIVALFQVGDTLEVIAQRFAALRLAGGGLVLSRQAPACSRPLQTKRITMYSAAWVKSQSRMSSTSNQETFRADIEGRLVVDVLRHCLTACNLASFSLADCVQSLLGQTLEVLGAHSLARLAGLQGAGAGGQADPLRLARYSMRRVAVVQGLLGRLAVIPEAIEMARATGLTVGQVRRGREN